MAASDPLQRSASARLAAARRHYPGTDLTDLERDFRAARLAAYVRRQLAADPPLTPAQRTRIAGLLLDDLDDVQ